MFFIYIFLFFKGDEARPNGLAGRAIMILFIPVCKWKIMMVSSVYIYCLFGQMEPLMIKPRRAHDLKN